MVVAMSDFRLINATAVEIVDNKGVRIKDDNQ